MKRLKAFTLLEMTLAMVLTSLVVAMGYSATDIVQAQLTNFRSTQSKLVDVQRLYSELALDFDRAETVRLGDEQLIINLEKEHLTYRWETGTIYRVQQEQIDSFQLQLVDHECYFQQALVEQTAKPIDGLEMTLSLDGEAWNLRWEKQYSAATLMQLEKEVSDEY